MSPTAAVIDWPGSNTFYSPIDGQYLPAETEERERETPEEESLRAAAAGNLCWCGAAYHKGHYHVDDTKPSLLALPIDPMDVPF
jgi:hypothetical protein